MDFLDYFNSIPTNRTRVIRFKWMSFNLRLIIVFFFLITEATRGIGTKSTRPWTKRGAIEKQYGRNSAQQLATIAWTVLLPAMLLSRHQCGDSARISTHRSSLVLPMGLLCAGSERQCSHRIAPDGFSRRKRFYYAFRIGFDLWSLVHASFVHVLVSNAQ